MGAKDLGPYIEGLRQADPKNDQQFGDLLRRGFELLGLFDKDVAREFSVSRPTVTRWRNGDNAPHPAMRPPVYSWLERRAQSLARRPEPEMAIVGAGSGSHSPAVALPLAARSGR